MSDATIGDYTLSECVWFGGEDLLTARIISLILETAIWGVFLVTYSIGTWNFVSRRQPASLFKRNLFLLVMNSSMFILSTAHLALTIHASLSGFVDHSHCAEMMYDTFFDTSGILSPTNEAQFYIYATQSLIGDGFMLHRLSVVYNRQRNILILPIILLLIDAVSGYISYANGMFSIVLTPTFFAFSFLTNALCSSLIFVRILKTSDALAQSHMTWKSRAWLNLVRYRAFLEAVIQSAAIYSAASITFVVTFFLSPNIGYVACLIIFSPLIGLVFSLMVIQITNRSLIDNNATGHSKFVSETSPSMLPTSFNTKASTASLSSTHVRIDLGINKEASPSDHMAPLLSQTSKEAPANVETV